MGCSGLRAPKREWEGATLRNGETLCNNLLPLKAAQVSDTAHNAAVAAFMADLAHAPHRYYWYHHLNLFCHEFTVLFWTESLQSPAVLRTSA